MSDHTPPDELRYLYCEYLPDDSDEWLPCEVPVHQRGSLGRMARHLEFVAVRTGMPTRIRWCENHRNVEPQCRVYFPSGHWTHSEELGRDYWGDLRHPDPDKIVGIYRANDIPF